MGRDCCCWRGDRIGLGKKPHNWAPKEMFKLTVRWPGHALELWYRPRRGYRPHRLLRTVGGVEQEAVTFPLLDYRPMKRRKLGETLATEYQHLAPLESTVLSKLHNLVKHVAIVKYDDGTPRTPGTWMLKTMGIAYVVVVKDPDACAQLQCTGATVDDALSMADLLLGSEDAPWEVDSWALARQPKGKRKSS